MGSPIPEPYKQKTKMLKTAKIFLSLLLASLLLFSSCSILKKNSCGCPPIPKAGKMRH
jgi:hypothetical protein